MPSIGTLKYQRRDIPTIEHLINYFWYLIIFSFPPPFVDSPESSIDWLYNELDVQWRKWLPTSVSNTVRRGAFYSVLIRPGFRLISLNMNYCNNKNWWVIFRAQHWDLENYIFFLNVRWLLINSTDPATELQWFIYELQSAEFNGEKVHVIGKFYYL